GRRTDDRGQKSEVGLLRSDLRRLSSDLRSPGGGLDKISDGGITLPVLKQPLSKKWAVRPAFFFPSYKPHEQRNSFRPRVHGEGEGHPARRHDLDDHECAEDGRAKRREFRPGAQDRYQSQERAVARLGGDEGGRLDQQSED